MIMKISEIKRWAKEKGYTVIKDKGDEESGDPVTYYWYKTDDHDIGGIAPSVSKVALAVFNHMTENKWVEYQQKYQSELNK
jgi:hypothetical protein